MSFARTRRPRALSLQPGAAARVVLGLDPGSIKTGWGVVRRDGPKLVGVAAGIVRISDKLPLAERLRAIHRGVCEVIEAHGPQVVAVEDIFFAKHPQAALGLGHARGVALLAAAQSELPVAAYPPSLVKRSIAGNGRADKRQVALLVGAVLGWRELPGEDATDALAVAITHLNAASYGTSV